MTKTVLSVSGGKDSSAMLLKMCNEGIHIGHGIIKNVGGASYFDGGYEKFSDAVEGMMDKCLRLTLQERVSLAKRHYCNDMGEDYMIAVGSYDEETGEAWESMTLAEAVARMEDEEEEEE